jgi:hypothetical protein
MTTYQSNEDSTRVEAADADADPVHFWRQGGGFRHTLTHAQFHAAFKLAPPPPWHHGTVTADWFQDDEGQFREWPCWSNGDRWNGWGMPYFTKATIDQLIGAMTGLSETAKWVDGKLMFTDTQEDETYEIVPMIAPGCAEPLYGLGAGHWCWDAVEFPGGHHA